MRLNEELMEAVASWMEARWDVVVCRAKFPLGLERLLIRSSNSNRAGGGMWLHQRVWLSDDKPCYGMLRFALVSFWMCIVAMDVVLVRLVETIVSYRTPVTISDILRLIEHQKMLTPRTAWKINIYLRCQSLVILYHDWYSLNDVGNELTKQDKKPLFVKSRCIQGISIPRLIFLLVWGSLTSCQLFCVTIPPPHHSMNICSNLYPRPKYA